MSVRVPLLDVALPAGWRRVPNAGGPLTWTKGDDAAFGVLQAMVGDDPGFPAEEGADCAFGRMFVLPRPAGRFRYFKVWCVVAPDGECVMFTWLSDLNHAGEAEGIVRNVRQARDVPPALVERIVGTVREEFARDGDVLAAAVVFFGAAVKLLPIEGDIPAFASRVHSEAAGADAVAIVAPLEFRHPDGGDREGIGVYIEAPGARMQLILPVEIAKLGEPIEVIPNDGDPLSGFFPPTAS
jgi:hypothetical protein